MILLFVLHAWLVYNITPPATPPPAATIRERIAPPKGYTWVTEPKGSFGEYLQLSPLKPKGSKILDYTQSPIGNQYEHIAILDYDIGRKNLQQCADVIIRLRADYLWKQKRYSDIGFSFTNGDFLAWNDYKNGLRPVQQSHNKIAFQKTGPREDTHDRFLRYLETIFIYAGTISLNRDTKPVKRDADIKTGDVIVTPGSPGHAVIIVGRARNASGRMVYLLAQGYTPAQSIHVLTNPFESGTNPWYKLSLDKSPLVTARYSFSKANIRSF
jgi:hypothetical protein